MTARSLAARRLILLLPAAALMLAVGAMVTALPAPVLADEPYIPPTPEEAAAEQAKQALADAVGQYAATGVWDIASLGDVAPDYCTEAISVSCSSPGPSQKLSVYARRQINNYYCGPASTQAVLNYTRNYFYDTLDGQDPVKNWKKQSVIGAEMGTDSAGSSSSYMIKNYLNGNARNPAGWTWSRSINDSGQQMYNRIVSDAWNWSMPLVLAVHPHKSGQIYFLPSWPDPWTTSGHFIAVRGYSGSWDGTNNGASVYYVDSSGDGGMDPGRYTAGARTMWEVNALNGKTIVW